jgi:iron complex outermembrane recepter protein
VSMNATNIADRRFVSSCIDAGAGCFYGARRNLIGNVGIKW